MASHAPMNRTISALLYLAIFLLPFGQLLQLSIAPTIRLSTVDAAVFLVAIVWLGSIAVRKKPFSALPLAPFIVLFVGIGTVSLVFSLWHFNLLQVEIGSLYLVRWIFYAAIYFVVYEQENKPQLLKALTISGVISAFFGITQYFLYPNLRNLMYLGWDPHEYRVFGTFFDSGFAGIIYVLTLILIVYFCFEKNTNKIALFMGGTITYIAFALTYARSSYVAFLAAFFILSILKRTYKIALFSVILLGTTILLLPRPSETSEGVKLERTASVAARGNNYLQTLEIIKDNLFFGVGFNNLRYENIERGFVATEDRETSHAAAGSDASILFVAATTGIFGLIGYMLLWYQMIRIEVSKAKSDHLSLFILPTIGALLINSVFLNSLFYIWVMLWIWILLGISHGTNNTHFITSPVARNYFKSIFAFRKINR